jgi:excisionase family DNA binding protein
MIQAKTQKAEPKKAETQGEELIDGGLERIGATARLLNVSRSTVYQLIDTRKLPSVRIGKCRRVPRNAILEYVARNTVAIAS